MILLKFSLMGHDTIRLLLLRHATNQIHQKRHATVQIDKTRGLGILDSLRCRYSGLSAAAAVAAASPTLLEKVW